MYVCMYARVCEFMCVYVCMYERVCACARAFFLAFMQESTDSRNVITFLPDVLQPHY